MSPKRLLIVLLVLLVAAGAGLFALRKPLLEEGIVWWLKDQEIPLRALTVAQADHRAVILRDVLMGPGDILSAGTVELAYALPDLVSGKLTAVRIDDLRIEIDLLRDPAQIEKVAALFRRLDARLTTGTADGGPTLPPVFVGDGGVSFAGTHGSADITFAASALPKDAGGLVLGADLIAGRLDSATASAEGIRGPITVEAAADGRILVSSDLAMTAAAAVVEKAGPIALNARAEAAFDPGGEALDLSLVLSAPDAGVGLRAGAQLSNLLDEPAGSFTLSGEVDAAGPLWTALEGLAGGSGTLTAEFAGGLSLPLGTDDGPASERPPMIEISGEGALAAEALQIPGAGRADAASLAFAMTATGASLVLKALPGSRMTFVPDNRLLAGLPSAAANLLHGTSSIDLSRSEVSAVRATHGDGTGHWHVEMQPHLAVRMQDRARFSLSSRAVMETTGDLQLASLEGEADLVVEDLSVALPLLRADTVKADLAVGFKAGQGSLEAHLRNPGTVSFEEFSSEGFRVQGPVDLVLTAGTAAFGGTTAPNPGFTVSLDLQPDDAIRSVVGLDGAPAQSVEARLGPVRMTGTGLAGDCYTGTLDLGEATLASAGEAVDLNDTRVTLSHDCPGGGLLATASIGAIRHLGDSPLLAPVSARAHLTDTEEGYAFDGAVSLTDGTELFVVSGAAAADGLSGDIAVARTAPLAFTADGPSPTAFSPALGVLKRVRGQVDGTARYRWSQDGTASQARLDLRDLSFDVGAVAVQDLDLGLALQPAWPPVTPAGQVLSIGRVDVGEAFQQAALQEIEIDYDLLATTPTQLRINGLNARFLDGTIRLDPFVVDPVQPKTETVVHAAGLDMSALAALTKLDSLTVTGRLGGTIPIILDDGKLAIRGGRLDAAGPGRLSYSSVQAAALLRGQGEEVDLMLQALQDFRYDSLGLDLDKTADDDLSLKLSLLGNNPKVLDGHPFRVNLNLTSQITPVLDALAVLYRMSRETLERVWTTR